MQPALIIGSLLVLIAALFILHRVRLAGHTEYFTGYFTLLWFITFFASAVNIVWKPSAFPDFSFRMSTAVYALCFIAILLVYILEGIGRARRLILLSILVQVMLVGVQLLLHAWLKGTELKGLFEFKLWRTFVSLVLTIINLGMAVVLFQFLVNRLRKVPIAISLTIALLLTFAFDSLAYTGLTRPATFLATLGQQLTLKSTISFALLPFIGLYLYMHRNQISLETRRGSFDVFGHIEELQQDLAEAHEQLKEYAAGLEEKVEERTRELQDTLADVQKLKRQQDGDYFLTSLLIKPLAVIEINSKQLKVESYTAQKKKFTFNKWTTEIGGDISIAHRFTLREREYCLVLNADAMGKSIQGAGGALVLGVVVNALVNRTRTISGLAGLYPEQWMKACFMELQSTFVTFDGSMLISLAAGLIDEVTGVMYYFNAEHPQSILYRDGKASFLEKEAGLRKIGVSEIESNFRITTIPLEPGDIIFMGSDGRDDVITGTSKEGQRIINEDENLIVSYIQKCRGDLPGLVKQIESSGSLMDDLSLVKILWKPGNTSQIGVDRVGFIKRLTHSIETGNIASITGQLHEGIEHNFDPKLYRSGIRALLKENKSAETEEICLKICAAYPAESEFLFLASYSAKMNHRYEMAADFGERFRLRNPENFKSMVHLADIYRLLGNVEKAREIAELAAENNATSQELEKLRSILNRSA